MLSWLTENLSTLLISLVLLAVILSISLYLIRQRKAGKSSCGGSCAHCAMHGRCHSAPTQKGGKA